LRLQSRSSACAFDGRKGSLRRRSQLVFVAHALDPGVTGARRFASGAGRPGVFMCRVRVSRSSGVAHRGAGIFPTPPCCRRVLCSAWPVVVGWSTRLLVSYCLAGSSARRLEPRAGVWGRSTAAGPSDGAALKGASVAPPLGFSSAEMAAAASTDSGERRVDAGHCAAPMATLTSPDREIVLLRVVAGVSIPDI
jgi:hypothetical protein